MPKPRGTPRPHTLAISEFKATCLAVLEQVRRSGASVVVTKRGVPIAEIIPPSPATVGGEWIGAMRGTATFADDLIAPAADAGEWDALHP
jgi:prevent-host-death family protein